MKKPIEQFDNYLEGNLTAQEIAEFNLRLESDDTFKIAFEKHKQIIFVLNQKNEKDALKSELQKIHQDEYGTDAKVVSMNQTFASKHGRTIAVAASTAFVAVLTTIALLSTGGYLLKKQSNDITELKRDVMQLQASNNGIVEGILEGSKINYAPANFEGSAFALNNLGYIVTSFHLVNGADSIFIQNNNTERTAATMVFSNPKLDLAILKLSAEKIYKTWQIPFILKDKKTEIGDKVFTLGYPRKEMVYGEGSLSSLSGLNNDTCMFQISIPVNPGNSGGPLLDEEGNIIGVIRGKISGAEATGFAIKSQEIISAIDAQKNNEEIKSLSFSKKSKTKNLKRSEQIKKINPYVFNIMVYKGE
jgi:S1-C subfamily serine protease